MKASQLRNENWMIWEFWDSEGYYGLTIHDKTFLERKSQLKFKKEYYLKVLIPQSKCAEGKFPTPDANIELNAIDDALIKILTINQVDCKNVNWTTYFGAKRFVYEVNDIIGFEKCIAHWKDLIAPYVLEYSTDEPWSSYNEIAPDEYAWIQHNNQNIIERILSKGGSSTRFYELEFSVSGKKKTLEKIASALQAEGGLVKNLLRTSFEVIFESKLIPDEINSLCYFIHETCISNNCNYDGWPVKTEK